MALFNNPLREDHKIYEKLYREHFLLAEDESRQLQAEELAKQISEFVENQYARHVFEKFVSKKPELITNKTGEMISWDEAFGSSFDEVPKSLRHSLVGLVEGGGRYRFK